MMEGSSSGQALGAWPQEQRLTRGRWSGLGVAPEPGGVPLPKLSLINCPLVSKAAQPQRSPSGAVSRASKHRIALRARPTGDQVVYSPWKPWRLLEVDAGAQLVMLPRRSPGVNWL